MLKKDSLKWPCIDGALLLEKNIQKSKYIIMMFFKKFFLNSRHYTPNFGYNIYIEAWGGEEESRVCSLW